MLLQEGVWCPGQHRRIGPDALSLSDDRVVRKHRDKFDGETLVFVVSPALPQVCILMLGRRGADRGAFVRRSVALETVELILERLILLAQLLILVLEFLSYVLESNVSLDIPLLV